jgi:hypothetical protein
MDFVTFELAKKLKEKGFPQRVFGAYEMCGAAYFNDGRFYIDGCICNTDEAYTAPTISQVLKWLREENAIHIDIVLWEKGWYSDVWCFEYYEEEKEYACKKEYQSNDYNSYEQAALAGIEYVLDNLT